MVVYYYNTNKYEPVKTKSKINKSKEVNLNVQKSEKHISNPKNMGKPMESEEPVKKVNLNVQKSEKHISNTQNMGQNPEHDVIIMPAVPTYVREVFEVETEPVQIQPVGVVRIKTNCYAEPPANAPYSQVPPMQKSATGFFVKNELGEYYVITNAHAVKGSDPDIDGVRKVTIETATCDKVGGKVVMEDDYSDLSFIEVDECELSEKFKESAVLLENFEGSLKDISLPSEGTRIVVMGFSGGIPSLNVTRGIIETACSAPYALSGIPGVTIRFSANIEGGNSGGPLFDEKTMKLLAIVFEGSQQINYASPIDLARAKMTEFVKARREHPNLKCIRLGLLDYNLNLQSMDQSDLSDYFGITNGLGVRVKEDCGELRENDVVMEIDGMRVTSEGFIIAQFANLEKPIPLDFNSPLMYLNKDNSEVEMKVKRDGKEVVLAHKCTPYQNMVSKYLCDSSHDFVGFMGHTVVPLSLAKVVSDVNANQLNPTEIFAALNAKKLHADDQALVLVVNKTGVNPTELTAANNGRVTEINEIEVNNIRDAVIAMHRPVERNGKKFLTMSVDHSKFAYEFDPDKSLAFNLASGLPSKNYSCSRFESLHEGLCPNFDPQFSTGKVTCKRCNKEVATISSEENRLILSPVTATAPSKKVNTAEQQKEVFSAISPEIVRRSTLLEKSAAKPMLSGRSNVIRKARN